MSDGNSEKERIGFKGTKTESHGEMQGGYGGISGGISGGHECGKKGVNGLEKHLLSCFRKLNEKDREELLSIMEEKIENAK